MMYSSELVWIVLLMGMVGARAAFADDASRATRGSDTGQQAEQILRTETTVSASLSEMWHAWTTTEGVTSFGPPEAKIELRVGGMYEWYFIPDAPEGSRGAEGCRVLSYLPMKMLSFTWNAPPSIPKLREARVKTHVVVEFTELDENRVKVVVSQLGFGQGEDWDKYYAYFDKAWPSVLHYLKKYFEPHPADAPQPDKS
ncbi:MAG: SRPBCC domain-containing protein [Phycisphaerales bacterium]|nr:MAG: SRPBCC domain-containing protein [Phycisphaerales bacterium]